MDLEELYLAEEDSPLSEVQAAPDAHVSQYAMKSSTAVDDFWAD